MLKYGLALLAILFAVLICVVFSSFADQEAQDFESTSQAETPEERAWEIEPRRFVPVEKGTAVSAEPESPSTLRGEPASIALQGQVVNERDEPIPEVGLTFAALAKTAGTAEAFPGSKLFTDSEGRFEFRTDTRAPFIQVTATYKEDESTTAEFPAGSTGVVFKIFRKAQLTLQLESAPETTLEGLRLCLGEQQTVVPRELSSRVVNEFSCRISAEPGLYDFKITSAFGDKTLFSRTQVVMKAGEITDLGLVQIAQEAIRINIHLRFPEDLKGAVGFLECVEAAEGEKAGERVFLKLATSGQVATMLVQRLPLDLRAAFDRSRLLLYSLTEPQVTIELERGIGREFVLETAMVVPVGVKLKVGLSHTDSHRRGDEVVVEQGKGPYHFHLSDYGRHELSLRLQIPKADAFDRTVSIPLPDNLSTVNVTREDESAIRLRLNADLEMKIREEIEAIR